MKPRLTLPVAALLILTAPAFAQDAPGEHFITNFDVNEDGAVTLAEAREKRGEIFYMFDQDEDGTLSDEEYSLLDQAHADESAEPGASAQSGHGNGDGRGAGNGLERELTDLNGDGVVTEEEFIAGTESWFLRKDRSGDGVINAADFGPRR